MAYRADGVPPKHIARLLPIRAAELGLVVPKRTPAAIQGKINKVEGKRPRAEKLIEQVSFRVTEGVMARFEARRPAGVSRVVFYRRCFERGLIAIEKTSARGATP
ncbi:hypothetical protein [Beijerinckia sp. L45]|uniref:hypothetical protein n=1 Tax=Beijerinckia sp. L45 TaxID=1641855 RepID=UPI00131BD9B5|nr:hypothetical protein [Beijerinckia sp. L45]